MTPLVEFSNVDEQWNYWYPRVYGYFYKRIEDKQTVEDLTAETITTAFLAKNVKNFKAYLWKVAHNYLVKYIHTKNTNPMMVGWSEAIDLDQYQQPQFSLDETIETTRSNNYSRLLKEMTDCFYANLSNEIDKKIIHLSIVQEKNSTQIAQELSLIAGTVRQKLARSLDKLKRKCVHIWYNLTEK